MNKAIRVTLIAAAASLALVGGIAIPANAVTATGATHKTLAEIQASGAAKSTARITAINTAIARITANTYLTDADRATILGTLNTDLAGMQSLQAAIAADTTVVSAAADYKKIFFDYRVYAVAIPQARFAAAADGLTARAVPKLTDAHQKLSDALTANPSKSTPALQASLADMQSQIDIATAALTGLSAAALAVTPTEYNSNHAVLLPVRQSLAKAIAALKQARLDGRTIAAALK